MKVGFIGYGKMGRALAMGARSANVLTASQVRVYDLSASSRSQAKKDKIKFENDLRSLVSWSEYIFLCVKPQGMADLFNQLRKLTISINFSTKTFVSIAAGIRLGELEKGLGSGTSVFRVMPNTPALLQSGMSGVCRGKRASASQSRVVEKILRGVGDVVWLSDEKMDAVTAVSGSGPAYIFYLAESMIQTAKILGLTEIQARQLVHQTCLGAGRMLAERTESARQLRLNVTSPGGTTEAAIREFEKLKFKRTVERALFKAARRSKELSQKISLKPGKTV